MSYEVTTTFEDGEVRKDLVASNRYQDTYLYVGEGVRVQHVKFLGKVERP